MKKRLKDLGRNLSRKSWILIIIAIILIIILILGYFMLFIFSTCNDKECFFNSLTKCKRVSWIREDSQAAWSYKILRENGDSCKVQVKLLKIKQGTVNIEDLQDKSMLCNVIKSETRFPEKIMSQCSGPLREELQEIIIQRMHSYLLENVGQIEEGFEGV